MEEPKRTIEIEEFVCPFCNSHFTIQTSDIITDEEGERAFVQDGWTCNTCGSENDIFHESAFIGLKDLTLESLANMNDFDILELFQFASYFVQKRELKKATKIMKHIVSQDPDYDECKNLLEKIEKVIELNKLASRNIDIPQVMFAMEDQSGEILHFLDKKTGEVMSLRELEDKEKVEEISESDDYLLIQPIESSEAYRKMEEFIEMVDDENLKEKLEIAINGPGAFRRFKDVLANYSGTVEYRRMWFDFYNSFLWSEAMDFLIFSFHKNHGQN